MRYHFRLVPALALAIVAALALPALGDDARWTSLFDGQTLDGWSVHGGFASYKVEDGTIVGTTVAGSPNTFLCKGDYKDFMLEVEVQCDPRLNSGVQVRSHVYDQNGPDPLDSKKHRTNSNRDICWWPPPRISVGIRSRWRSICSARAPR